MTIVFVGIDLAKNVFALHGVDEAGKAALVRPVVRRDQLLEAVAKLPPCTIGMEASGLSPFKQDSLTNEWSPAERFASGPAPCHGAQGRL